MAVLPGSYCAIIPTKEILGHGSSRFDTLATQFLLVYFKEVKTANVTLLICLLWVIQYGYRVKFCP